MAGSSSSSSSSSRQFDEGEGVPANPSFVDGIATKDVPFGPHTRSWLRLFLPVPPSSPPNKLPLLVFFHGGGFVSLSPSHPVFHALCADLAKRIPALVVSVAYRLAPLHRLPAAYDDALAALKWLSLQAEDAGGGKTKTEPWVSSYADFSACFLSGSSSGANIAHHVMVAWSDRCFSPPLQLRGLVLRVPYFGGESRTPSEIALADDPHLPLKGSDKCWSLALPEGANRDHPFSNVLHPDAPDLQHIDWPPTLVVVGGLDILHDRQIEYVSTLQRQGKSVSLLEIPQGSHFMTVELAEKVTRESINFIRKQLQSPISSADEAKDNIEVDVHIDD